MMLLIAGLILFIGVHSFRIFADSLRERLITRYGEKAWKGIYSLVSLLGFALIIWGYGLARAEPVYLWNPPIWTHWVALPFTWLAFVLLAAANIPRNHFKQRLGHPMYAGVKIWAFAHLISNGRLEDVLLFGLFLAWAIAGFAVSRRRDRHLGTRYPEGTLRGTGICLVAGTLVWALFAFVLHRWLFGVSPL